MTRLDGFELRARPGDGLAARFGDVVVFACRSGEQGEAVERLLDTCRALGVVPGPLPGEVLVSRLRSGSVLGGPHPLSFCVVAPLSGGLELVAQGDVEVAIDRRGALTRHHGHEPSAWIDLVVDDGFTTLTMRPLGARTAAPTAPAPAEELALSSTVVPAGEVVLSREEPPAPGGDAARGSVAPPEGEPSAPEAGWDGLVRAVLGDEGAGEAVPVPDRRPPDESVVEAVVLVGPAVSPGRPPLPIGLPPPPATGLRVAALRCPAGHPSPPSSSWCIRCGRSLIGRGVVRVEALRPSLGLLVGDDGAAYALDAGYVIGTDPSSGAGVVDGDLRPLRIADRTGAVAPAHTEIRLAGWDVLVVDLGGAAGTEVRPPGAHSRQRLQPDLPEPLSPGSVLVIGMFSFVFVAPPARRPRGW